MLFYLKFIRPSIFWINFGGSNIFYPNNCSKWVIFLNLEKYFFKNIYFQQGMFTGPLSTLRYIVLSLHRLQVVCNAQHRVAYRRVVFGRSMRFTSLWLGVFGLQCHGVTTAMHQSWIKRMPLRRERAWGVMLKRNGNDLLFGSLLHYDTTPSMITCFEEYENVQILRSSRVWNQSPFNFFYFYDNRLYYRSVRVRSSLIGQVKFFLSIEVRR